MQNRRAKEHNMYYFLGLFLLFFASVTAQETQGFVKVDDGSLYYKEIGCGLPIIVVHGGPGLNQEYFQPQLCQLAQKYRLIFYDQRGSGKSLETSLDPQHINSEQFVKDLDALRTSLGLDKFILMGHSWGGLLAMQYAVSHQDHLLGLILLNSAPADYRGQQAFVDEFTKRTKSIEKCIKPLFSYEEFQQLKSNQVVDVYRKLFSAYFYDPNQAQELNLCFTERSGQSGFKVMEEMMKTSWLHPSINLFPQLKMLNTPTLIIHGQQDITPVWTAEEIKNAIPHSKMVILDKAGHFPYIEQPTKFFNEICRFLNQFEIRS